MRKILLIDDDAIILRICKDLLEWAGFEVISAQDGPTAIELLNSHQPDLVVLDLFLDRYNGVEVLKFIRTQPHTVATPVFAFSQGTQTKRMEAARLAGATRCLSKDDYEPDRLVQLIHDTLEPEAGDASLSGAAGEATAAAGGAAANDPGHTAAPIPSAADAASAPTPTASGGLTAGPAPKVTGDAALAPSGAIANPFDELRELLRQASLRTNDLSRLPELGQVCRAITSLCADKGTNHYAQIARLARSLDRLLGEMDDNPQRLNPSSLYAVSQAARVLETLMDRATQGPDDVRVAPLALIVSTLNGAAISAAFDVEMLRSLQLAEPVVGLKLLAVNRFDVIVLDLETTELDNAEFSRRLRAMALHAETPVISVTDLADFQTHLQTDANAVRDFIATPYLPAELAVKALAYCLK